MEKDLFQPIKEYFEALGYVGDGEVEDIDLYLELREDAGVHGPEVAECTDIYLPPCIAVELKLSLDFKSVQQAALRQKLMDTVFIGIPRPKDFGAPSFKDKLYLLKRLGIGLIVVSERSGAVEIVSEPVVTELSKYQASNKRKRLALSEEFHKRQAKTNTGGVHATKLVTSYRENVLLVLDALVELGGCATTSQVRDLSGVKAATSMMYQNYYGWFASAGKGTYRVTEAGYTALEEFESTIYALKKKGDA